MRLLSGSLGSNHQDPIGNKPLGFHGLSWVISTRIHNNIFYAFYAFFFFMSHTLGHRSAGGTRLGHFQRRWV